MDRNVKDEVEYTFDSDSADVDDDTDTDTDYDNKQPLLEVSSSTVDDTCCKKNCLSMFDDDFKSRLKSDLSRLQTMEKKIFLFGMISINSAKLFIKKKKSSKYFEYTVKEYGITRNVCRNAFVILHDTTSMVVRSLCDKMFSNYLIPSDKRGKHKNNFTIPVHTKESIKCHFNDIMRPPTILKCFKKSHGEPNLYRMWNDFNQKHPNKHVSRSAYTRCIRSHLTPEVLNEFMQKNKSR